MVCDETICPPRIDMGTVHSNTRAAITITWHHHVFYLAYFHNPTTLRYRSIEVSATLQPNVFLSLNKPPIRIPLQ